MPQAKNIRKSERIAAAPAALAAAVPAAVAAAAAEEMANFSAEQFNQLLQVIGGNNNRQGSFTTCTARFRGERDSRKLEEFIAAITTFKQLEKINDDDTIKAMPMLLEDDAASWWLGVKSNVTKFDDLVKLLRTVFSPPKPAWRIYLEIMECKQQANEPIDSFICKKRVLFSSLEDNVKEDMQLSMIYGLLNQNIRDRVSRDEVDSCVK